jgi:hypothetical protein
MLHDLACEALSQGKCLELRYDGQTRIVEVHVVGRTKENHGIMRVWQVKGGVAGGIRAGWKLMRLDETSFVHMIDVKSDAPRPGYNRDDPAVHFIICRV